MSICSHEWEGDGPCTICSLIREATKVLASGETPTGALSTAMMIDASCRRLGKPLPTPDHETIRALVKQLNQIADDLEWKSAQKDFDPDDHMK